MNTSDKVNFETYIAGSYVTLNIRTDEINAIKDAKRIVDSKFAKLRQLFPKKTEKDILAMIAIQFAYDIYKLRVDRDDALQTAELLEDNLDNLLKSGNI